MELNKKALNIQFFADDKKGISDYVDEDKFDNEDFDKEDSDDEDSDNDFTDDEDKDSDVESDKSKDDTDDSDKKDDTDKNQNDEASKKAKDDEDKKQKRKDDAAFAKLRREKEQFESEKLKAKEEGIVEGIRKAYNNTNKFTNKSLTDEHSVKTFLTQLEMEKEGLDPINDYPEYIERKAREQSEKSKDTLKKDDWYKTDSHIFHEKYPDVSIEKLGVNPEFKLFAKGKIGNLPLSEIYEDFMTLQKSKEDAADVKARKAVAKSKSSAGPIDTSKDSKNDSLYTLEELKKMSSKEIDANWDKVEKSYDALQRKK